MALVFEPKFLDDIRDAIPLRSVIGRRTKLERSGNQWKACCPFHGEKTPSFHIYDDHFHCYGCGVHGDVFSFVMQSEGLSFPEAVAALAAEAGLDMPKPDAGAVERSEESTRLRDILSEAAQFYRKALTGHSARHARAYLQTRGLTQATIDHFGLGWADADHGALIHHLKKAGHSEKDIFKAGLLRTEKGGAAFFSRIIFPIHDRRGVVISFGGRAMGDAQPKYVNGTETPLFSKKRTLYNLHHARQAVLKDKKELLVVEGYMDVIALSQAGFTAGVAPLGTAVTAEQIELMWRESSSPIICLDGDAAGSRASLRVAELALPMLRADRTLRFCRLPRGEDPDSLIKNHGPDAMKEVLARSHSLHDEIFTLLRQGCDGRVPEQRAALRQRLDAAAEKISDKTLGYEYRRSWRDKVFESFRRAPSSSHVRTKNPAARTIDLPVNFAVRQGNAARLDILTEILLRHPALLDDVEQAYSALDLPTDLALLREGLLEFHAERRQLTGKAATSPIAWFEAESETHEAMARCARLGRALLDKYDARAHSRHENDDSLLVINAPERWWHFYGLVNFPAFSQEVTRDVAAALSDTTLETFPDALKARLSVLERLKAGEPPDDA